MDTSLESVLSESAPAVVTTEAATETTQQPQETTVEATGEEHTPASPAEQQNDPLDKASQGLKAAAIAERQKRQEAERQAKDAAERAQMLEQQLQALQRPQQQGQEDAKPLRQQFETEDDWLDARDAWRDRQRERESQEQQARDRLTFLQRTAQETVRRGQEQYSDFDAVINTGLGPVLTPVLQQTLFLSDRGHEVAYHLGKNPQEAQRVSRMPPLMLARELALIEARLTTPEPQRRQELPETLTQSRDARGRFEPVYSGPTPLNSILK